MYLTIETKKLAPIAKFVNVPGFEADEVLEALTNNYQESQETRNTYNSLRLYELGNIVYDNMQNDPRFIQAMES